MSELSVPACELPPPVFRSLTVPAAPTSTKKRLLSEVRLGGVTVLPGDVVVADAEAVLFFPPQLAGQVIESARRTVDQEEYERELVRQKKHRFRDVYPLSPELRKKYEAERRRGGP